MKIILQLIAAAALAVGCSKSDITPDQLVEIQYHLSGISESATVGVKEPAGDGLTTNVLLSNEEGEIYSHKVPANYQIFASYETSDDIEDDFRLWITYKGKEILVRTKSDAIVRDGKNLVAISGILSSEL